MLEVKGVREDKLNWNDKASELEHFSIIRQPPTTILGKGKADVKFEYKNNKKTLIIYGPEDAVFERAMWIIKRNKNPAAAVKMQMAFADKWKEASYHKFSSTQDIDNLMKQTGIGGSFKVKNIKDMKLMNDFLQRKSYDKQWNKEKKLTKIKEVKDLKGIKTMNDFLIEKFYEGRKRNPLEPNTLLENEINKVFEDVNSFADSLGKNKSSVYHHTSGKREISKKVAMEYAKKLKCDPVDLMFNKLSIPVWGKVDLLKSSALLRPGEIYSLDDKNMERVIVPRDLYQDDIKAIKISARGSMYDNQVAFYYRATSKDDNCLNKLSIVAIEVAAGPVEFTDMKTDEYYFGLYESVKGESNLINPDPYASDKNKYILKNFNPKIIAPVIALVNPEAITDKTKMRDSILPAVLIREEERLQAESAALKLAQIAGQHSREIEEKSKRLQDEIKKLHKQISETKVRSDEAKVLSMVF